MCRFSKLLLFSFFFCKDGSDRLMKRASFSCCKFLCVVLAAAYLKCRRCRLSCLPFVWYFFSLWHTHTHTHTSVSHRSSRKSAQLKRSFTKFAWRYAHQLYETAVAEPTHWVVCPMSHTCAHARTHRHPPTDFHKLVKYENIENQVWNPFVKIWIENWKKFSSPKFLGNLQKCSSITHGNF